VHGQDRYFQMDLIRRQAAGELAQLFGPAAVDTDRYHRFHGFRSIARAVFANLDRDKQVLLERYADGVNVGLESLGALPFEYYLIQKKPAPWTAEDSLVVVYAMFLQLNDERADRDVRLGLAKRVMPPAVYAWLYPDGTPWDAPLVGDPWPVAAWPAPSDYDLSHAAATSPAAGATGEPARFDGSNNWAVSGALTENGRAMVANDMHLGLSVPNIWYRVRLVQTGAGHRDVSGVSLPGTPLVVAGSNGRVAWAYTNSYGDWSDAVLLKPGALPGTYRTPDGDRTFSVRREKIRVAGAPDVELVVRETIWGPVDEDASYPDGEIAVAWIAHHPRAVNLEILDLETVGTVAGALDIANRMGMPPQNFVVGDADGNVGWTIAGQIPRRTGYDATGPTDFSSVQGWAGWREPSEYPRIINPPDGLIWTANARVVDGDALALVGDGGYDLGARARQIRDDLRARDRFTAADMLEIQIDDRALFLTPWRDLLLDLLDEEITGADPQLGEYRELVATWLPRAAPESVGYRLVRGFRLEVQRRVFDGVTAPARARYDEEPGFIVSNQFEAPLWQLVSGRPAHLLPAGYESWDELLLAAVYANLEDYARSYDTPLSERTWGEVNTAAIRHPLSAALPVLSAWLDMEQDPLPGDSDLPRAQGTDWGASQRFSVAPGDEANGLMQMPTGQSGHPLSEFYRAGHADWVAGRPAPFLPGPARYTLKLRPAEGKMEHP
jgi:penicillin amidase